MLQAAVLNEPESWRLAIKKTSDKAFPKRIDMPCWLLKQTKLVVIEKMSVRSKWIARIRSICAQIRDSQIHLVYQLDCI
uniref:Uncharacterized protein n=1 Tax=Oryza sativa subsp. japonica TaxID=39947 RepID=Q8H3K8_ORYSJ|nr:hypothetical protein [Oryza sativa Japonica Group]